MYSTVKNMHKYKSFLKFLWSSVLCFVFLYLFWIAASRIWDIHVQFEETEMENGKEAIRQAVNISVERCLSTARTSDSGKLQCNIEYGDLDYISLTFNVTIQKVAVGISRGIPFSKALQCHNTKGECHTIVLFLVGWWFGSRHSILFCIVLFAFVVFVCIFMYPIVMSFISSVYELSKQERRYNQSKFDYGDNYSIDHMSSSASSINNSILKSESELQMELIEIAKRREREAMANRLHYNESLKNRYVNQSNKVDL